MVVELGKTKSPFKMAFIGLWLILSLISFYHIVHDADHVQQWFSFVIFEFGLSFGVYYLNNYAYETIRLYLYKQSRLKEEIRRKYQKHIAPFKYKERVEKDTAILRERIKNLAPYWRCLQLTTSIL